MFGWSNDELERNSTIQYPILTYEVLFVFLTIENNSGAKIHRPLGTDYREENAMNLKNVQQWQMMFTKERTNTHNDECKG